MLIDVCWTLIWCLRLDGCCVECLEFRGVGDCAHYASDVVSFVTICGALYCASHWSLSVRRSADADVGGALTLTLVCCDAL